MLKRYESHMCGHRIVLSIVMLNPADNGQNYHNGEQNYILYSRAGFQEK